MASNAAETKRLAAEFFAYAQSPEAMAIHGGVTEFGNCWTPEEGWRTYMRIGDKAMMFAPGWGRGFARECRERAKKMLRAMPPEDQESLKGCLEWLDDLEAQCKETMALRASNASPVDVLGPERGQA